MIFPLISINTMMKVLILLLCSEVISIVRQGKLGETPVFYEDYDDIKDFNISTKI